MSMAWVCFRDLKGGEGGTRRITRNQVILHHMEHIGQSSDSVQDLCMSFYIRR
jgi:hypothetical protein